jgi:transcriptional regulator
MYEPALFRVEEKAELVAFLRAYPLGLLIAHGEQATSADLVPFLVDDGATNLRAHVAQANPLAQSLAARQKVLVVFCGPQAYVSPGHYPCKAQHGRVVPTWNYTMAQASGPAQLREEPEWIAAQITELTAQQEAARAKPWAPADAPENYIAAQMRAIVGIEIEIEDLRGKYKLSQNRSEPDRQGVMTGLWQEAKLESQATALLMRAQKLNGPEAH